MSELARQFEPVPQKLENVRFTADKSLESETVKAAIAEAEAALHGQGRLLVRRSGTEKLIRFMAEGDDKALVDRAVTEIGAAVKTAGQNPRYDTHTSATCACNFAVHSV